MLATSDLWFRYQDEPVLKGLNLDFSLSPVTGLVGANGCGKSTLFMNLSGLLRPQKGAVLWQGKTAGLQQARTTGAAPASCDGFSGP
ncbi:cobalt transporter ATP-binding subunit [Salmonella enterica subsp. enterica serovar Choleraesuis str. 0006]|nr:cobalt transporter ATP-binding subunit [Salmonella enterica subsp. enterica serovar Choleraesuis str. 0006]